jgi:hypothetical protein
MNANKKQKYFQTALVISISLLLWRPLPASSFSQNGGGAGTAEGDKASGITMQTVAGKVVETMDSGGYTYALVEKDGAKTWVALPKSRIAVGNEITCQPGMVMNNFSSPSLNRSFKHIVFSRGITSSTGAATAPAPTPAPVEATDLPKVKDSEEWKDFFK